jgi:hypothetical protein
VAVNHLAIAAREHGNLKSEFSDRGHHAIDSGVILAGIAGVEDQLVNRP